MEVSAVLVVVTGEYQIRAPVTPAWLICCGVYKFIQCVCRPELHFVRWIEIRMRAIVRNDNGEVMAVISAGGPSVVDREEAEIMASEKALALL